MNSELMILIAGAALGGFIQGISGFAFAMVAMSVWAWGVDPKLAAVMAVFGGLTGQVFTAISSRRSLYLPTLTPYLLGAAVGVPLGVLVLPYLNPQHFKLLLGSILLVFCPIMFLAARLPKIQWGGRGADALAGALGGVMGGIGGFTGVAPAVWCTLRGYDKDQYRSVLQNFNLAALATTFVALVVSGAVTTSMLPQFAIIVPALLIPSVFGAKIYTGLSADAFRKIVLALLTLSGLTMVVASAKSMWLT